MDEKLKKEIIKRLKRTPNELEKSIFEAMWSEHCGYLHSKKYLQKLNSKGALYSDENSGGVKIGEWGVFFKVESHNHPCAVEPYQGAATGIGGIIRDILALNARPIALLNSLKFGRPDNKKVKHIINGVTSGISDYGNSTGIANVAGEVIFDECYNDSPLVNVMALGIAPLDRIKLSSAAPGLEIVLVGSNTGYDGAGGAAFASKELSGNIKEEKIHVQMGDPFTKKVLIEATLEILALEGVTACQDCGAAGLLSSTTEMAYKGKCSIELDLECLHLASDNMSAADILLSESQERMVFAVKKESLADVIQIAKKYELSASYIGRTCEGSNYVIKKDGRILSSTPLDIICEPYLYDMEPACVPEYINTSADSVCSEDMDAVDAVERFIRTPEFASKNWFFEQWDYAVGGRTYIPPQKAGAAAVRFFENDGFIGACIDSKPRQSYLDPYLGSQNTFLESYRNLVSSGFEPKGATNCLNFGNPEKNDTKYQFLESIEGMAKISKELNIPVVSGNVSFYNESPASAVYPTVTIAMTGFCKSEDDLIESVFCKDESIFLLGNIINPDSKTGGSLYQKVLFNYLGGKVDKANVDFEIELKEAIFELKKQKVLLGASDVSKGGLLGSLLSVLFNSEVGFSGNLLNKTDLSENEKLKLLFGEIEGRYIFSTKKPDMVEKYLKEKKLPFMYLGKCIGDKISFDGYEFDYPKLKRMYFRAVNDAV